MLHDIRLEMFASYKHSSLLGPFLSYVENEVLWKWLPQPYSQNFIFFVSYKYFQKARVLDYTHPEKLASDKQSNILGPFASYEENEVLW